jgi:hypothetical protein
MGTRTKGPLAGFGWLARGIEVSFDYPKQMFGAAFFLLLAALIPQLLTLPVRFHAQQMGTEASPAVIAWTMGLPLVFTLFLLPLHAGILQLVDAAEHGLKPRVTSIFSLYGNGEALRVIGYGLTFMVAYIAVFAIIFWATGRDVAHWYVQALSARANHLPPPTTLPSGFGITLALFFAFAIFLTGFHAIALGQIAQRRRSVFGALGDGLVGALKNLLPLLMLTLGALLTLLVVGLGFFIIVMLLVLIGKLTSMWVMLVFAVPLYIAFFLLMCSVSCGVMYHVWFDICGDDPVPTVTEPLAA